MARQIDDGKQQIASLFGNVGIVAAVQRRFDLISLFPNFRKHRPGIVPVEADGRGGALQIHRARQCGLTLFHAVQQARLCVWCFPAQCCTLGFFFRLDAVPKTLHLVGRHASGFLTEHMGMSPCHLRRDGVHNITERERTFFLCHACMKHHLQQQIAEFLLQVLEIAPCDCLRNLIGLLDGVGGDGREGLLQIPRASSFGRAQRRHDVEQG